MGMFGTPNLRESPNSRQLEWLMGEVAIGQLACLESHAQFSDVQIFRSISPTWSVCSRLSHKRD